MKKLIISIEHDLLGIFAVLGLLLILFPERVTSAVPWCAGIALLLHGIISAVARFKFGVSDVSPGTMILHVILGGAILFHRADAIGAIGAIWAMVSLNEVAEEINEAVEHKKYSVFRGIMILFSLVLAIMLLFDPFEHFAFHVRILGLEMIFSVFVRRHNLFNT